MEWYAAHTVIAFQRTDGLGKISVYENTYLISALNLEEAKVKALDISNDESDQGEFLEIDGFPAKCIYCGVRKLNSISNVMRQQNENPPVDGSEITYIEYEIDTVDEFLKFNSGETVRVNFVD